MWCLLCDLSAEMAGGGDGGGKGGVLIPHVIHPIHEVIMLISCS